MGYESRLYILDKKKQVCFEEVIASFNLSCVENPTFYQLFSTPISSNICVNGEIVTTDSYNDPIKWARIDEVVNWLETEGRKMDYRRIEPLIALLKGFNPDEWDELRVAHYGY